MDPAAPLAQAPGGAATAAAHRRRSPPVSPPAAAKKTLAQHLEADDETAVYAILLPTGFSLKEGTELWKGVRLGRLLGAGAQAKVFQLARDDGSPTGKVIKVGGVRALGGAEAVLPSAGREGHGSGAGCSRRPPATPACPLYPAPLHCRSTTPTSVARC